MIASRSMSIAANTASSASSDHGGRRSRKASLPAGGAIEGWSSKLDIFRGRALPGRIAEECRGMIRHDQRNAIGTVEPSAEPPDRLLRVEQRLRGERPEGDDHLGTDQLDLPHEIRAAGLDFLWLRIAIARRPMFEDVADVNVLSLQVDRAEDLVEELTGLADERTSKLVLRGTRCFADADEPRLWMTFARHRILRRLVERATGARGDGLHQVVERREG